MEQEEPPKIFSVYNQRVLDHEWSTIQAMYPVINKHPRQRIQSPSKTFSALLHIFGLANFAGCFGYLIQFPTHINDSTGWHFQYLTIIGLLLATATFILGLLSDVTMSSKIFALKNLFSVASAPMEILIAILYWGISAIDKHLVVPPEIHIDLMTDLKFHFFPPFFLFLDLMLLSPPWTIRALPAFGLSSGIAIFYWIWVNYCFSYNGFYPYPLFELLNTTQRAGLFGASALIMGAMTISLKWAYGLLNGVDGLEVAGKPYMPKDKEDKKGI